MHFSDLAACVDGVARIADDVSATMRGAPCATRIADEHGLRVEAERHGPAPCLSGGAYAWRSRTQPPGVSRLKPFGATTQKSPLSNAPSRCSTIR